MDSIIFGATWFVDTINQRLRTQRMKLPQLSHEMTTLVTGRFSLEVPEEISPLSAEMVLRGSHDDVRSLFGREPGDWVTCTYYERLRDIVNGKNKGRVVILKGLLLDVDQPATSTVKAEEDTTYKWGTIVEYRDIIDGKNIHWFNVFRNKLVINGINYMSEANQIVPVTGTPG